MESNAFDRFSRAVGTATSRRTVFAGLTEVLAALIAWLAPGSAPAAVARPRVCRPLGTSCFTNRGLGCCRGATCQEGICRCPKRTRRCGQRCLPRNRCCRDRDCPANQNCQKGRCQCPAGKKRCGKRCIARNACCRDGDCGTLAVCVRGSCACAGNARRCGDACVPVNKCCDASDCDVDENCVNGTCVTKSCGAGGPCRVFTTAQTHAPNLGGVAGADALCQTTADGSPRTRGGTYRAWIADSTEASAPVNRFTNLDRTGPYVLVDNAETLLANDWADLTTIKGSVTYLRAQINVSEAGNSIGAGEAWTNVSPTGERLTETSHCDGWTSDETGEFGRVGNILGTSSTWTNYGISRSCADYELRLYCFEQG